MVDPKQLHELRKDSGKRLPDFVVHGMTRYAPDHKLPVQLTVAGGSPVVKVRDPRTPFTAYRAEQKVKTLGPESSDAVANQLNDALLGGADYPILSAVMGAAVGLGTGGAGFLFTVATTSLSVAKTTRRVLARDGDEVWRVEEIGKVTQGGEARAMYVIAYLLVDPHRNHSMSSKGWLLHEVRYDLVLR